MLKRKVAVDVALLLTILLASQAAAFSPLAASYSFGTKPNQLSTPRWDTQNISALTIFVSVRIVFCLLTATLFCYFAFVQCF